MYRYVVNGMYKETKQSFFVCVLSLQQVTLIAFRVCFYIETKLKNNNNNENFNLDDIVWSFSIV